MDTTHLLTSVIRVFSTPRAFLALVSKSVGVRLRVYPPGQLSLCPTPYHVKTYELGLREQALSITGCTARNLRPDGYGTFAHQHDHNLLTCTPSFMTLTTESVGTY